MSNISEDKLNEKMSLGLLGLFSLQKYTDPRCIHIQEPENIDFERGVLSLVYGLSRIRGCSRSKGSPLNK